LRWWFQPNFMSVNTMTAKKTEKSAKAGSKTRTTAKGRSASGLLRSLKGALSKKKPAAPAKPARPARPAAKASGTKAASAKPKPSTKTPATKASRGGATVKRPAAAPRKPAPKAPAAIENVTKTATKKTRPVSFDGPLSEESIKVMSENDYMNDAQLEFFRRRLLQMRQEVLQREMDVKERLHEREVFADPADRATAEEEHWLDLRLRERESLLLRKIDDALRRIEAKEYGYCEKTGDPIGIPRLLARPTATVCVDVKGQDERVEAQYRDR
jgi:DnaK suppressor protein